MDGIRKQLRRLPPAAVIKVLRKVFAYPAPAARMILNDITRPRKTHKPWIHKVSWNNAWSGCWIGEQVHKLDAIALQRRIDQADIIFFNVHGGGFRLGTSTMYMDTYIRWITFLKKKYNLKALIMSIDYRLAPEYKYPSPVEDVVKAYEHLVQTMGVDPGRVVITGDSAGASLLLEMLFLTHDPSMFEIVTDDPEEEDMGGPMVSELPRPAGAVFVSPLVTDETTSESWRENVKYDFISQHTAKVIKRDYFEKTPNDPDGPTEASPILGIAKLQTGFHAFLPQQVLMYIGNKEVLRDDALDLAEKAEQDGVQWESVVEDCVHDWFCVREVVKDKAMLDRADTVFADFCYRSVIAPREGRVLDSLSARRTSEGLEAVPEDNEEGDDDSSSDEFHEALSTTDTELEAQVLRKLEDQLPTAKSSTLTVYV
ncbi:Alpha/Beta hydrolase protein [Zychaea mexicana]|uniref:Alpha/Beta hydrolase protein n=1 Tax=Zychaea mexicana TaxID=64656 RepID=UPI0022FE9F55|nr:Alpha/Beta hydrolase protein [Zychaea mexicana]KAI9494964.1 Alpha/Beta hydrolase protein [Zychaea mexicana]